MLCTCNTVGVFQLDAVLPQFVGQVSAQMQTPDKEHRAGSSYSGDNKITSTYPSWGSNKSESLKILHVLLSWEQSTFNKPETSVKMG